MIGQIDNLDDCFVDLWCSDRCNNGDCSCNFYVNWFCGYTFSSRKEKKFLRIFLIVTNLTYFFYQSLQH